MDFPREWITPAVVTWMLKELVENDDNHVDLTEKLDWYFLAVHNPDGYEYTRTTERFWRKTRSGNGSCIGVDANRNYGYQWATVGSSSDPCSDGYHGSFPWSEVEVVNVRNFILERKGDWVFYDSIHSYGQFVLLPWAYTTEKPEQYDELERLSLIGTKAIQDRNGTNYTVSFF